MTFSKDDASDIDTKPRIAIMGEFSAGKSTLVNLLLGQSASPVKVTATQLPPVWYSFGEPATYRIDARGRQEPIDPDALDQISPESTQAVRVFLDCEVLEFCDLIDMPGTSDPNMSPTIWDKLLAGAHGLIWCTAANQAWRQSEAAWWDQLPMDLQDNGLLLVTRMDTLHSDRDRARVMARVLRETDDMFKAVHPISLTQALASLEDLDAFETSGANAFADAMIDLIEALGPQSTRDIDFAQMPVMSTDVPRAVAAPSDPTTAPVVPRRITPRGASRRDRPSALH